MISVKRLPVGQLQTNCYLVKEVGKCVIIDPGDDADYIQRIISDENLIPTKIIATHGHFDHILAVYELKLAYNIPFLMSKYDEFLLKRMSSSAKKFTKITTGPPPKVDNYLKDKDKLVISNLTLDIILTPGHTPGSVSLYNKEEKIIISGDLIFSGGGVGRTDFAYSDLDILNKSVDAILKLPRDTKVYPGHGEATSIDEVKKYLLPFTP